MKYKFLKSITLSAAALAASVSGTQVFAQQGDGTSLVLEELIVTARKREETLIDTPIAISVFGKQELESAGYTDIIQISRATPGLFIEDFNQGGARVGTTPRFRGVFFSSGSRLQQTATVFLDGVYLSGGEQTIAVNELERVEIIKGPQSALFGRNTFSGAINYITKDPSEEFRADVDLTVASEGEYRFGAGLEGQIAEGVSGRVGFNFASDDGDFANAAVQGQDLGDEEHYSITGTLLFEPNDRTRIKLRGSYREVDDGPAAFVGASGFTSHNFGGFALDANGVANQADSIVPKPGGSSDTSRTESVFRGTVTEPPADRIGGSTSRDLIPGFRQAVLNDRRFVPGGAASQLDYTLFDVDEFGLKLDSTRLDLHIDFDITDDITLSILGGYNEESYARWFDFSQNPDNTFVAFSSNEIEDKSIEARLSGTTDKFDWTVGASYVDIDIANVAANSRYLGLSFGGVAPIITTPVLFDQIFEDAPRTTGATTTGIFGSINYRFNDIWSLTAEVRRQEDELRDGQINEGLPAPISPGEIDSTLPRVTLTYEPSDTTTLYATYSEGNLPGGFNPEVGELDAVQLADLERLAPGTGVTFDEESLTNYEFGWKQQFADGRGAFNMALFYMEREDEIFRATELVINTNTSSNSANPLRTVSFTSNGAATDIYGIELDGTFIVNDALTLAGSIAYINAEIASFPAGAGTGDFGDIFGSAANVEGQEAPRFPPFTFSANATYEQPFSWNGFDSWYTRADFFYTGKFYDSVSNVAEIDSAFETNLRFGLRGEKVGVELFVTNLFDEDAPTAGSNFADLSFAVTRRPGFLNTFDFSRESTVVGLRDKRQVGVRVKYNF